MVPPRSAWMLCTVATLSCARLNPAYGDEDAGGTGSMTSGAISSATADASSGVGGQTTSGASGGQSSGGSSETGQDTGQPQRECWILPMEISAPTLDGALLDDVPVMVDLSNFDRSIETETLRFFSDEQLLPHELERDAIAWVRVPTLFSDAGTDLLAVMGPQCDAPPQLPSELVWSNDYLAVFHFDQREGEAYLDSVQGIHLQPDDLSTPSQAPWTLGSYVEKSGDAALLGNDASLDLGGNVQVSTLAWVRLDEGEADALPWIEPNARHREVIAKLPGYRLAAVLGETSSKSMVSPRPFFNILADTAPGEQDITPETVAVAEATWTMLVGTYDGATLRMIVDDTASNSVLSQHVPMQNGTGDFRVGRFLRGGLDEVRVASVARSAAWMRVQYASMTDALIEYGEPTLY